MIRYVVGLEGLDHEPSLFGVFLALILSLCAISLLFPLK